MTEPLAVSVKHAAQMLDFKSTSKVYELIDRDVLPTIPNLTPIRIPVAAIKRLTQEREQQ